MKICTKCEILKPLDQFYRDKRTKDGKGYWCKSCSSINSKKNYKSNLQANRNKNLKWYYNNIERAKAYNRQYYRDNKEKKMASNFEWKKKKYVTSEIYRLKQNLRSRLYHCYKHYSNGKKHSSKYLGIDFYKIIEYIGPCPGKREDYHIDHIKPLSLFDFNDQAQIQIAFAPENHQWLKKEENLKKSNNWKP